MYLVSSSTVADLEELISDPPEKPTNIGLVEVIRASLLIQLWPAFLPWPRVYDTLWVNRRQSWWSPQPHEVNWARLIWWN